MPRPHATKVRLPLLGEPEQARGHAEKGLRCDMSTSICTLPLLEEPEQAHGHAEKGLRCGVSTSICTQNCTSTAYF